MPSIVKQRNTDTNRLPVLYIEGDRIDASNADVFCDAMRSELQTETGAVIDFSAVEFIDSAGIAALVRALDLQHPEIAKIRLCAISAAPPAVSRILELVGLSQWVPIFDRTDEALNALSEKSGL